MYRLLVWLFWIVIKSAKTQSINKKTQKNQKVVTDFKLIFKDEIRKYPT